MKIGRAFVLLVLCTVFGNCSKEETPVPKPDNEEPQEPEIEVYFTLNTFEHSNPGAVSENWVILHDADGHLLEHSAYVAGDKLQFKATKDSLPSNFSVSYLSYFEANGQKIHTIRTTTGVATGYVENFGPFSTGETNTLTKTGEFDIFIGNIPNPNNVEFPVKVEISSGRGRLAVLMDGTGHSDRIELEIGPVEKYEGLDNYLISILDHNNQLKYYYLNNPAGVDISLDYNTDFVEVEKDISFSLPDHQSFYLNITGFEEGQEFDPNKGYRLHDSLFADLPTNPLRIGYADVFPKYRTILNIRMEGYSYANAHFGMPLNALSIPDKPSFAAIDTSIDSFQFDVDIDYLSSSSTWDYIDSSDDIPISVTSWTVFAEKGYNPTIGGLPIEIIENYPALNIDLIEYKYTTLNIPLEEGAENQSNHSLTLFHE